MTTVIQAEGLGKRYRRGVRADAGLRHVLEWFARSPWRALRGAKPETFWALKDVSLEVREGEVLGLIGRNGCAYALACKVRAPAARQVINLASPEATRAAIPLWGLRWIMI